MIYKFNLWFLKLHTHMAINLNQGWKLLTWFVIVEGNLLIDMEMNQLSHIHLVFCKHNNVRNLDILIYVKYENKWCAKYQTTMFDSILKALEKNIVNKFKLHLQNNEQCQPIIMTLKTQLHNDQTIYIVRNQVTNHQLPSQVMWDCYIINVHLLFQKQNQQLIIYTWFYWRSF